jgi:Ca-activated chloride channel family protein
MTRSLVRAAFVIALALLFSPSSARAEGSARTRSGWLRDAYTHVRVTVDGDLARTVVTQVFVNDLDSPVEATYGFPLPADAAVTGFASFQGGNRLDARAEDRDRASADYQRAADEGRAASLAEDDGQSRFRIKLAAIEARGSRRIELSYTQTLAALGGERTYVFPAARAEGSAPPTLLDVEVALAGDRPIEQVTSLNHPDARIARDAAGRFVAHLSRAHGGLERDLVIRWQEESRPMDLAARAVRARAGEPAYVEARLAFNADPTPLLHEPVDVVLAIDTSLSMVGEPLERARALAQGILDGLTSADRVELITFSGSVDSDGALEAAEGATLEALRARVAGLRAGGRTNLAAALDEAADRLRGSQNGLLVLMTDGQPTIGDEDLSGAARRADFQKSRVVIAHFNYPSRKRALEALFPSVTTRYLPDGPAGAQAVSELTRLAIAPTIEDLRFQLVGGGASHLVGAIPTHLAVGESLRVMARADGNLTVRLSGRLHDRPFTVEEPLTVPASPDGRGDRGLPVEWARMRIGDLETKLDGAPDSSQASEWQSEIRALGKSYGLMTRFTSFVVADSLSPDRIKPGDPELRVHAPRTLAGVRALLPWGETVECVWQPDEELWLGRFLVPRGVPDGLYRVRVFVDGQAGTQFRETLFFRVDSKPPTFLLTRDGSGPLARGAKVRLTARVKDDVFDVDHDGIRRDLVDLKRIVVEVGGREIALERAGDEVWQAEVVLELPPGEHVIKLVATDFAANSSEASLPIEVR